MKHLLCLTGLLVLSCAAAAGGPQVVGLWHLGAETPGRVADSGPNHLDGQAVNVQSIPGAGEDGIALRFSNSGAQVDMPPAEQYACGGGAFTLSLWIRTRQRQEATIVALARPGGATRLRLSLAAGGRLQLELWGPLEPPLISAASVADGHWHYVTAVYDIPPGEAFLYVDDALVRTAPLPPGGPLYVALRLGNDFGCNRPFRGDLDDVVLTAGIPDEVGRVLARFRGWGAPPRPGPPGPPLPDFACPDPPPQGDALRARLDEVRTSVRRWLGAVPPALVATEGQAVAIQELRATPVTVQAGDLGVPSVVVKPEATETGGEVERGEEPRRPAAILADPEGKAMVMEGRRALLEALATAGAVACAVDLSPDPWTAARQLLAVAAYLRTRPDVQPDAVLLVCWGGNVTAGLAAALGDPAIARAVMLEAPSSTSSALAAALAPRPLWVQGALDPARWVWPIAAYRELAPQNLLLSTQAVSPPEIAAWVPGPA